MAYKTLTIRSSEGKFFQITSEIGVGDAWTNPHSVICLGDFAITNIGNNSTFSYCTPSIETIDFGERVKER
jgi:hypothetical protein